MKLFHMLRNIRLPDLAMVLATEANRCGELNTTRFVNIAENRGK
jgi:hypothetical protein